MSRRKLIRFTCFWIVFSFFFSCLNLAMKTENDRWSGFYHLPKDSVEVIFFGNSHSYTAFQPTVIDDILSIDSYVLGISSENIVVSYYELEEALKTQHPKAVVLETFSLDINDAQEGSLFFSFVDAGYWNKSKLALASHYLTPSTAYSLFPSLRTRVAWNDPSFYVNEFVHQVNNLFSYDMGDMLGASLRGRVIDKDTYTELMSAEDYAYKQPAEKMAQYLDKFHELCRQNNVQLIFATAPIVSKASVPSDYYAPFDVAAYAEKNGIPMIVFDRGGYNELHFYNSTHLDVFGSLIVSIETAKELSHLLDIPIDEATLEFYNSFVISGYATEIKDNQYSIKLITDAQNSLLEYNWKLIDADGGQMLEEAKWSGQNSFRFEIQPDTSYLIECNIRNTSGTYEISAIFPVDFKEQTP